jgi:hypothetical protein
MGYGGRLATGMFGSVNTVGDQFNVGGINDMNVSFEREKSLGKFTARELRKTTF